MQFFNIYKRQIITITALLAIIVVTVINAGAIKAQLNDWKLLPQPERLTELYFEDHAKLPTTYLPGTEQSFRFTVHNLEYRYTDYDYRISQLSEDGTQRSLLSNGSFSLQQDTFKTVASQITPAYTGNRSQVAVTVTNRQTRQDESIHYWATSLISAEQYQAQQSEGTL